MQIPRQALPGLWNQNYSSQKGASRLVPQECWNPLVHYFPNMQYRWLQRQEALLLLLASLQVQVALLCLSSARQGADCV
jgi:hypothetical protein